MSARPRNHVDSSMTDIEVEHLQSFRKLMTERRKQYVTILRSTSKEEKEGGFEETEQANNSTWGWFIDPSLTATPGRVF